MPSSDDSSADAARASPRRAPETGTPTKPKTQGLPSAAMAPRPLAPAVRLIDLERRARFARGFGASIKGC